MAAFTFFSGNWFISNGGTVMGGIGILWSVNVEEQFYLLWPVLMRYGKAQLWRLVSAGIIACSYAVLFGLGVRGSNSDLTLRFNTLVEMQFFAAGALLALWLPRGRMNMPAIPRLMLGMSGLSCWVGGTYLFGGTGFRTLMTWWAPEALYGSVLIGCIALFLSFYGMPREWLPQPLLWLGKISYGLYVYHSLVLALMPQWPSGWAYWIARIGAELTVTVFIAGFSYYWFEKPFLRWKEHFTFVSNRPA